MARTDIELASEERRRQITLVLLAAGLLATSLPVMNQRALFSPLGDVPILGELTPTAYAVIVGGPGGPGRPGRGRVPTSPNGRAGTPPPVAFAARVPSPDSPGGVSDPAPFAPAAGGPGQTGAGGADPVGGSGIGGADPSGGGNGGGGGIDPTLPGGGVDTGAPGGIDPGTGGGIIPDPTGAVPEPATWLTMILGFAVIGWVMRRARRGAAGQASLSAG